MGHFPPITQCLHGTDATAAFACCFGLGREGLGWGCEGLGCGCEGLASSCHLLASFFMCLASAFASHVCPDLSTITLSTSSSVAIPKLEHLAIKASLISLSSGL